MTWDETPDPKETEGQSVRRGIYQLKPVKEVVHFFEGMYFRIHNKKQEICLLFKFFFAEIAVAIHRKILKFHKVRLSGDDYKSHSEMYVNHWQPVFNYHRRQASRAYAKANKLCPENKEETMSTPGSSSRKKKSQDDGLTPGRSQKKQKNKKTVNFTFVADLSKGFNHDVDMN
jgi:hypothetical protein